MARRTLRIEIKKTGDGRPSLACIREDGSRTWARVHPFLPTHDLAHYAVESVLGIDDAFFGLIAQGWDIDAFAAPGAGLRLPPSALWVERIVGHIERGVATDAETLAAALALDDAPAVGAPGTPGAMVSAAQFAAIGACRAGGIAAWRTLPPGETLRLVFPATDAPS